jgi:hypothetical protein
MCLLSVLDIKVLLFNQYVNAFFQVLADFILAVLSVEKCVPHKDTKPIKKAPKTQFGGSQWYSIRYLPIDSSEV